MPAAGAASTHTRKSSVADAAFENDVEALAEVRRLVDLLPANNREKPPVRPFFDDPNRIEPSLDTLVPSNANTPYDMKELILKLADEGDFYEIQEEFAKNIITGFIRLEGRTVGVVANQPMVLAGCLGRVASVGCSMAAPRRWGCCCGARVEMGRGHVRAHKMTLTEAGAR